MFSKFELTNKGVELLNRVIAEQKTLKFTKFQIGKGDFSGDKKTLTQLVSKIDEFNVSQTNVLADGITNIKGFYDNRNLSVASKLTEIGIMAQLEDDRLTEVLFSYSNQPNTEAETIPSKESYFSRTFSVMNRTDNVTSVTFDLTIRQDKYNFGTLAEMKAADYLDVGDKVTLWGNAALGDSPLTLYIITDQVQSIQLNNKLYAKEYFKIVNDLTTGGADKALSGEMGKKLNTDKQDKTDSRLQTESKDVVGAINESLWRRIAKELPVTDLNLMNKQSKGVYYKVSDVQTILNRPVNDYVNFYVEWSGFASQTGILRYWSWDSKKVYRKYRLTNGTWTPWQEELDSGSSLFLGNAGITSVVYIQDAGSKTRGNGYIDKTTGKLYLCYPEDESVDTVNDVTVTKNFTLATNIANTNSIVSSKKSKYLGKKPVNSTFDVGEDFRNYKFIQVDLLSNGKILSTIVTTTNSKINQSVQFSGSTGESNNLAIFVTFNATNLVTQLVRNCDEVQIILTN